MHARLLRVFAAKIGESRSDDFQQLQHHGGHAAKMAGPHAAFEAIAKALDAYGGAKSGRIHLLGGGSEQNVHARLFAASAVGLQMRADISRNPRRAELFGIDKNRDDHGTRFAPRRFDQREMAGVQRAHGGHEADRRGPRSRA